MGTVDSPIIKTATDGPHFTGRRITLALTVNIEGIDGSGKGTQAKLLQEHLQASGARVRLFSFPRYDETLFGKGIGDFLNGRFGKLDQVSPFLAALLYAGDRFESRELLQEAIRDHDYVILDRYVASNIAHQASKLTGDERREAIEWITRIEHEIYGLPHPDLTILLNLPPQQAQELIAKKAPRNYTTSAADIQESDSSYLQQVHEMYLEIAAGNERWRVIDCIQGDAIRTIEDVAAEVRGCVAAAR